MIEYRLVPQLRNNCVVQIKKELVGDLKVGDIVYLIINKITKTFSILTKIQKIVFSDENVIYCDQRILGLFAENDMVTILKYNPAEAITVYLSISDDYTRVFSGDWTTIGRKSLENKVIDFGQEISFIIPWTDENGKQLPPIPVAGIINSTIPPPPVKIGRGTKIFLNKFPQNKLLLIQTECMSKKSSRVSILEKQLKDDTFNKIQMIKQNNYPTKPSKYKFKDANPKQVFAAAIEAFKGLKILEEPKERDFSSQNQDFLGTVVFYLQDSSDSIATFDIQVISNKEMGELIVTITAKDQVAIFELSNKYDKILCSITGALEQKVELLENKCPGCAGELPLNEAQADGTVECRYCRSICILPKSRRY